MPAAGEHAEEHACHMGESCPFSLARTQSERSMAVAAAGHGGAAAGAGAAGGGAAKLIAAAAELIEARRSRRMSSVVRAHQKAAACEAAPKTRAAGASGVSKI